jgi:tape measure domain-containing protein
MANEIAQLGFEIDTAALVNASRAADGAAKSLDGMGRAAETAASRTRQAGQEARKAGDDLAKTGQGATTAGQGVRQLLEMMRQMQGAAAGSGQQIQNLTGTMGNFAQTVGQGGAGSVTGALSGSIGLFGRLAGVLGPVGGAIAGVVGGVVALGGAYVALNSQLASVQDRFALLEGRLKNVYGSGSAAKSVFADLTALANKNAIALQGTAESFLRVARNNEAIGLTRKQTIELTDAVQMLGRVSGASAGELGSGMMQFSQALASGRLNGDELRSIMENMPALAKAIAQGLGVTVGQLRAMGAEGQLTGDKITKALLGRLPDIKREFEGLPDTTDQAFTRVSNAWETMLATMGKKLNSSGLMQRFARGTAVVLNGINEALRDSTTAELIAEATPMRRSISGRTGASRVMGYATPTPEQTATLRGLQQGAGYEALNAYADTQKEASGQIRAAYNSAQRIFDEVDPARKKVTEITSNLQTLTTVYDRWKARPDLFSVEETERIARIPGYISTLNKQLNDALPALEKYNRETLKQRQAAVSYGFGGGVQFGADIRKLAGTTDSDGKTVTDARAVSAVVDQRTFTISEQTDAINKQVEAERNRINVMGAGRAAEREAEASAKALTMQLEKFGTYVDENVLASVAAYRGALLELSKAQDASAAKQAMLNAQTDLAAQKAAAAALAAGGGSGAVAEAERRARRGAEFAQASPEMQGALATKFAAEDLAKQNSEAAQMNRLREAAQLQRSLAGASPREAKRLQQEQDARQFAESFSTAAKREEAYNSKLSELRAKDAVTVAQQLQSRKDAADLAEKEIALTLQGGIASRVAIARERELAEIRASGLELTREEVRIRLQMAEDKVFSDDKMAKAQEQANRYKSMWENAGNAIASSLDGAFQKMLDGERVKFKDFATDIMKQIAMILIKAQITQPIANMIGGMGSSTGGGALTSMIGSLLGGGGAASIYGAGGVIAGGRGITAYANGGLVSRPTIFPMANGAGLMGEAGAEAILPLKRGTDGKLGVGAGSGANDNGTSIVINDMRSGGEQVQAQEERGADGNRMIRVTIRDEVKTQMKSGTYDAEMNSQYGARRVLARR